MNRLVTIMLAILLVVVPFQGIQAEGAEYYENPPLKVIDQYLTEAALKHDVPPEIVKAVAMKESDWQQFENGKPKIGNDGAGIGIMQITNDSRFDLNRLRTEIEFNIDAGVQILNEKFSALNYNEKLPTINNNDRHILESWYFAVLAYNGKVQKNSPIVKATGETNATAYQEIVYRYIEEKNPGMGVYPLPFDFKADDFTYSGAPDYRLFFEEDHYEVSDHLLTESKYFFKPKDVVFSAKAANIRTAPTQDSKAVKTLPKGVSEPLTILEDFKYDQSKEPEKFNDYRQYVWYKVQAKDGTVGYTSSHELKHIASRLSGSGRYETAAAISQEGWEEGANTVVLAKGFDFPDALAGTPLAYQLDAPMLLTATDNLPTATRNEIKRLKAKKAILLGSTAAIGPEVQKQLEDMDLEVLRYGGSHRFATAIKIAKELPVKGDTAILAYGFNFPDALSIAAYAARNNFPIFLTDKSTLNTATLNELKKYKRTIVVGSEDVINSKILSDIPNKTRYGGNDRFATNADIVSKLPLGTEKAYIANGMGFADALTGAVLAAKNNAPLLLSNSDKIPWAVRNTIIQQDYNHYTLLGGNDVMNIQYELAELIK
ncbi:cell wall-binding repeat-containing protein [Mesobacillus jeotgali]|uniref:cell wall-binding repeat-containing protein n=1 Tax=Mesobacillus jeotgali TaxID=129985 RepID=UPI000C84F409|nr:cell wall-binding repeat-containing protein [Mesobacillus jeotgali]